METNFLRLFANECSPFGLSHRMTMWSCHRTVWIQRIRYVISILQIRNVWITSLIENFIQKSDNRCFLMKLKFDEMIGIFNYVMKTQKQKSVLLTKYQLSKLVSVLSNLIKFLLGDILLGKLKKELLMTSGIIIFIVYLFVQI